MKNNKGNWIEYGPLRDGSGVYELNGIKYKIVVQDLVTVKHRIAFIDGKEIARASKFTVLVRKLLKIQGEVK